MEQNICSLLYGVSGIGPTLLLHPSFKVDEEKKCLDCDSDKTLAIIASVFVQSQMFFMQFIYFQFRTGIIPPSSRHVFGRAELLMILWQSQKILSSYFIIDILAIVPCPQVVEMLKSVIFSQYVPRLLRIYPLYVEVVGAFWYLFGIERQASCWKQMCRNITATGCQDHSYYCSDDKRNSTERGYWDDKNETSTTDPFDYGIFTKVLKSGVVAESILQGNLSSLGQNLDTSTYFWEIVFAVSIAIAGLVLFSLLIGNMQRYLQSTTVRWMSQRMLPNNLRQRSVEEENLIRNLPKDLRRDIKRHLCLDLLKKMDQQLWDPLVDRLKPVLYTQDSYIVREGDPVDEMLFIMRGNLATFTTNAGDFCGEELLTWALYPQSSTKFPISTRTVEAKTEVQAFALMAEDLKTVASQFRKLHCKELQHTFKTWAACFIQSAWRRYSKKNHERALRDAENRLQFALANEAGTSASLGATIYVTRFAAHLLRPATKVLQLLPPKPAEPDFSAEGH
ncbi:hypothetical protein I3843_Q035200 [Carya illinoinensis]|nr:hypothetical protein I3843_Q035200 [Carya illinoinensis]